MTTLDLNGTTHTIGVDSKETYWQIEDTSPAHNGHLVLESGAYLQWEDLDEAGFTASCSDITVTVNGEADSPAYMRCVDLFPHHPWNLPPVTAHMVATRCHFMGDKGEWSPSWIDNHCTWGGEGYCTVNDVRALTGITSQGAAGVSDYRIELFIKNASDYIDENTGRVWDNREALNEIHDYDGREYIRLDHWPIIELDTVEFRTGSNPSTWEVQTIGPENDYVALATELGQGLVHLVDVPAYILEAIRVSYTYGADETPYKIRRMAMLIASIDTYKAATSPGTTNIYSNDIKSLQDEVAKYNLSIGGQMGIYVGKLPYDKYTKGTRWERLWQ